MATLGFQMKTQQTNDATLELKQVTRLAFSKSAKISTFKNAEITLKKVAGNLTKTSQNPKLPMLGWVRLGYLLVLLWRHALITYKSYSLIQGRITNYRFNRRFLNVTENTTPWVLVEAVIDH